MRTGCTTVHGPAALRMSCESSFDGAQAPDRLTPTFARQDSYSQAPCAWGLAVTILGPDGTGGGAAGGDAGTNY